MRWRLRRSSVAALLRVNLFRLCSDCFIGSIRGQTNILFHSSIVHHCAHHLCRFCLLDLWHVLCFDRRGNSRNSRSVRNPTGIPSDSLLPVCAIYSDVANVRILSAGFLLAKCLFASGLILAEVSRSVEDQPPFVRRTTVVSPATDSQCCYSSRSVLSSSTTTLASSTESIVSVDEDHLSSEYSTSTLQLTLSDGFRFQCERSSAALSHLQ